MNNDSDLKQIQALLNKQETRKAVSLCKSLLQKLVTEDPLKLETEFLLSEMLVTLGEPQESIAVLKKAKLSFNERSSVESRLKILTALSYHKSDQGAYAECAESWLALAKYSSEIGQVDSFLQALCGVGTLLEIIGEHHAALTFFKKAEEISLSTDIKLISLNFHFVSCYLFLNEFSLAQTYLDACKSQVSGDDLQALSSVYQIKIHRKSGNIKQAFLEIEECYEKVNENIQPWTKMMFSLEAGHCFIESDNAKKAAVLLNDALSQINTLGIYSFIRQKINQALSDAYSQQGNYKLALKHEKKAHDIRIQLISKIEVRKIRNYYYNKLQKLSHELQMHWTENQNKALKNKVEEHSTLVGRLEKDAHTDPLTGLHNRRWLDREINQNQNKSILLIDADHFKAVNDDYSHAIGDAVLVRLSTILESEVRNADSVSRYGGEEFVVLLQETNKQQVFILAERLRYAVEIADWSDLLIGRKLTISIGAAMKTNDEPSEDTLKRADLALYKAKDNGRNCFYFL